MVAKHLGPAYKDRQFLYETVPLISIFVLEVLALRGYPQSECGILLTGKGRGSVANS